MKTATKLYTASSLADYIIIRAKELGEPVSNLKIQYVLYFLWRDYYKKTGDALFDETFLAWSCGPVVPDVYYIFCVYGGSYIEEPRFPVIAKGAKIDELNDIIDGYLKMPLTKLVDIVQTAGTPWDDTYNGGKGNLRIIPPDLLISDIDNEK